MAGCFNIASLAITKLVPFLKTEAVFLAITISELVVFGGERSMLLQMCIIKVVHFLHMLTAVCY